MPISARVRAHMQKASWIRRMFEEGRRLRERHGADAVVDLSLGNPEVEPPAAFNEALARAVADARPGLHRYMPNAGFAETRAAAARHLTAESGVLVRPDDVIMVCGAAGGLNVLMKSILDPGDEVIITAPYFPEYLYYIDNHGGVPRIVETREDFSLDLDAIADALGERTRGVIVGSPNNPTGHVHTRAELEGLAALLRERAPSCYLISDEPYKRIVYEGFAFASILGLYERAVVVHSHSKDLGIPGERIGCLAFSSRIPEVERRELIDAGTFANRTLGFVNAPALMQRVVAELQGVSVDPAFYKRRRDLLCDGLRAAGYAVTPPGGAFYLFLRTPIEDDVAFVRELAERLVLTVPGSGFGRGGYIRISYCVGIERLERALPAFRDLAALHGLK